MDVWRRVVVGTGALVLSAGVTWATNPWWGDVLTPPAAAGTDADGATGVVVPLAQAAPAAVALARSLPVPVGGQDLSGTACHVLDVVRCWQVPGEFSAVDAEVLAQLATAAGTQPQRTWYAGPGATSAGQAARSGVDVDGHRVQVEVHDQALGRAPHATLAGVQTVLVTVDPA